MTVINNTKELKKWANKNIENNKSYVERRGSAMNRKFLFNQNQIKNNLPIENNLNKFYE